MQGRPIEGKYLTSRRSTRAKPLTARRPSFSERHEVAITIAIYAAIVIAVLALNLTGAL